MAGNRTEPMMVEAMPGGETVSDLPGAQELTANVMEEPAKNPAKALEKKKRKRLGEEVCFICFDGGELFLCDRKGCNKGYHPVCVKRDEAFLRAKGVWICGWHICSICEKDAYYKCYTCLYSLCRSCVKDGVIFCVRRNKGFCESCLGVVKLIEHMDEGNKEVEVDFDDKSTLEFLFKEYWVDLKEKLSLSRDEIAQAKNPCKRSNLLTIKDKSPNQQVDVEYLDSSSDSDSSSSKLQEVAEASNKRKSKKALDSHLPSKADSQVDDKEANEEIRSDKRRKLCKKEDVRRPQSNLKDYAAIDAHNISLIYLRRNLMEALLEDTDTFHNKVVGTFVRMRISSSNHNQDVYRLVQVIGTIKVDELYQIGRRKSDIILEISNLGKSEITPINCISNQPFSEDECKRLRQSIKCGLIDRLTVGQVLDKALDLQHARVTDWLETEIMRLSHLRDRASEMGHGKEVRECVQKLKLLKTPEEHLRRLEKVPEVHSDPNMDPSYTSDDDHTETDDNKKEGSKRPKGLGGKHREAIISQRDSSLKDSSTGRNSEKHSESKEPILNTSSKSRRLDSDPPSKSESSVGIMSEDLPLPSGTGTPSLVNTVDQTSPVLESELPAKVIIERSAKVVKADKIWHYEDPSKKIQGPFSMAQLRRWSDKGYFPADIRVWRRSEAQTDSVLLTDALAGNFKKVPVVPPNAEVPKRAEDKKGPDWVGKSKLMDPQDIEGLAKEESGAQTGASKVNVEQKASGEGGNITNPAGPIENSETQGVPSSVMGSTTLLTGTPNPNQMWVPPSGNQGETMQSSVPGFGDPTWVARPWNIGTYYQGPPINGAGWVPTTFPTPTFPRPRPPPQPRESGLSWVAAADWGISGQLPKLPPTPPSLPVPTLPPPGHGNPGWVSQPRNLGVQGSVLHHKRDRLSGSRDCSENSRFRSVRPWGTQSPVGSKGRQLICPFHRNGHCKKGAFCNHLHIEKM